MNNQGMHTSVQLTSQKNVSVFVKRNSIMVVDTGSQILQHENMSFGCETHESTSDHQHIVVVCCNAKVNKIMLAYKTLHQYKTHRLNCALGAKWSLLYVP